MLGNEILYSIKSKRPRVYFTFDELSAGFDISFWDTSVDKPVAPTVPWNPGALGFGVGVCKEDYASLNMEPLPGCEDIENDNYGTATTFINPAAASCVGSQLSSIA